MSVQILGIVVFSHDGRVRELPLQAGCVNIVTGASKTGKSAPRVRFCRLLLWREPGVEFPRGRFAAAFRGCRRSPQAQQG